MGAPPFRIAIVRTARTTIQTLDREPNHAKRAKVRKALRLLRDVGPAHPGLHSHRYHSLTGPNGEAVWESYVENRTPGAWRIWWVYGPDADTITVIEIGPHP